MSSIYFLGDSTSYIRIPNAGDLNFGTGDFTIEWYQYQIDNNLFPRVFQMGSYNGGGTSIGVSIESGQFYFWTNSSFHAVKYLNSVEYKNIWVHFAICRVSGTTTIYMNGTSIFSMSDSNNFSSLEDLVVSNESDRSDSAAFGGYMAYFHWVKGLAKYTADFTVPNTLPDVLPETVLLLTATSALGSLGNTVDNNAGTIDVSPLVPVEPPSVAKMVKSLFADNSRVYYKVGSLASCGVGTVRNSSIKSRKI